MIAIDDTGTDLWTVRGALGRARGVQSRFERASSKYFLKIEETSDLVLTEQSPTNPLNYLQVSTVEIEKIGSLLLSVCQ
jgi:hypothetical protein